MILPFKGKKPRIHPSAFVAPGAHVIGDVVIGKNASVWFGAVLRGDMGPLHIGDDANVQDGAVLHGDHGKGVTLGKGVIVGHQATVHACDVEDYVLVGIGSRILTGAHVGSKSLIGAGALVKEGAIIPRHSLVLGVPGKVVRSLNTVEVAKLKPQAARYVEWAKEYKKFLG